jgi:hypothetical protein
MNVKRYRLNNVLMERSDVDIYNLYEHVTYDYDDINNCLRISWDDRNTQINNLIINEKFFFNDVNHLSSHYWVEEIKRVADWSLGEILYINVLKYILDEKGQMKIFWSKKTGNLHRRYEQISNDGYLYVNWYDDKLQLNNIVKKDCLYNQDWEQIQEHNYILK